MGIWILYQYCYIVMIALEGKLSVDLSHHSVKISLFVMIIIFLFSLLLGISLIISGIGIYKLKDWARKLALFSLSLELLLRMPYLFIIIPLGLHGAKNYEIIVTLLSCILIIVLLFFKSVKKKFI